MSLRDRISKIGSLKTVDIDGLAVTVKTKSIRQKAEFQDALSALDGKTEVEGIDNLIDVMASAIVSIEGVDDIKEFLGSVPSMSDLIMIATDLNKALTEKESKNSSSPSESPTSTVDAPDSAAKTKSPAHSTKKGKKN